jgi:hypothetical protein
VCSPCKNGNNYETSSIIIENDWMKINILLFFIFTNFIGFIKFSFNFA